MAPTTPKHLQRPGLIFIPWCAGASRHERLVRKHIPDCDPGCALQSTSMPALHRRNVPNCRPMVDGGMRKCSAVEDFARRGACPPQGSGWGVAKSTVPIRRTKPQFRLFIPWCPGTSRHGRLARKHVPYPDTGSAAPVKPAGLVTRANACPPTLIGGRSPRAGTGKCSPEARPPLYSYSQNS